VCLSHKTALTVKADYDGIMRIPDSTLRFAKWHV
jgi:hypothetical protein